MARTTVSSKDELKAALKRRDAEIVIVNETLAKRVRLARKVPIPLLISIAAAAGAGLLLGPIGILPSTFALAIGVSLSGAEIAVIVGLILAIGATLTIVLAKDYDEIEIEVGGVVRTSLRRKKTAARN